MTSSIIWRVQVRVKGGGYLETFFTEKPTIDQIIEGFHLKEGAAIVQKIRGGRFLVQSVRLNKV